MKKFQGFTTIKQKEKNEAILSKKKLKEEKLKNKKKLEKLRKGYDKNKSNQIKKTLKKLNS